MHWSSRPRTSAPESGSELSPPAVMHRRSSSGSSASARSSRVQRSESEVAIATCAASGSFSMHLVAMLGRSVRSENSRTRKSGASCWWANRSHPATATPSSGSSRIIVINCGVSGAKGTASIRTDGWLHDPATTTAAIDSAIPGTAPDNRSRKEPPSRFGQDSKTPTNTVGNTVPAAIQKTARVGSAHSSTITRATITNAMMPTTNEAAIARRRRARGGGGVTTAMLSFDCIPMSGIIPNSPVGESGTPPG